ncbi:MAG TPA: sigma-70 family RNA polymerase sigma factor [Fimbriimonadaceae bacterium]|nr:sigma-70 family RNA polymerase sigma factor [Fimbriimonadaceae bacterium]
MTKVQADDGLLIDRSRNGDRSAFDQLVARHQQRAYQYAFRLTRDPEEASDIVAESFIRMYKALHNFKGDSAFTTWMYRIATNCFLDIRKKKRNKPAVSLETTVQTSDGEVTYQFEDTSRSPQEEAERSETMRFVRKAIELLPEYQRAIIVMYHAEMKSYEEIAETLSLPIGTVKSRLNRARVSLRALLEPLGLNPSTIPVLRPLPA